MPCRRKKTTIKKTRHFSRTALLLAALVFIICLAIPANQDVLLAFRILAWSCLIASQWAVLKQARRVAGGQEPIGVPKDRRSVLG